jgi:hypothetical protein
MDRAPAMRSLMAGFLPHSRASSQSAVWPRELGRGALFLGASSGLYWSSFAVGYRMLWTPDTGPIYLDILLAWVAVVVHMAAWPSLWHGLRDLRARRPDDTSPTIAWRAFLLTLLLIAVATLVLPLEYHAIASSDPLGLIPITVAFPYMAWTFVPILALHAIVFGRVAVYREPRSRYLVDAGAVLLLAVAAATTAMILQSPGVSSFVQSWSVGRGILPAAALVGYILVSIGFSDHALPEVPRIRSWTAERAR